MSRVIFVNRFYWPDHAATGQLLTDLARSEAARGAEVTVITSRPPHAEREQIDHGVHVIRVWSTRGATSLFGKALDFATFYVTALAQITTRVCKGDILVVLTDPPLLGIVATLIGRLKRAQVIHWLQDIYPEVAAAVTGRRSLGVLRPLRNVAWRRAIRCITLSHEMASVVVDAGVPRAAVRVIPNWPPAGLNRVTSDDPRVEARRQTWGLSGKFIVGYSGNLGRVHDLNPVIAGADKLRDQPDIAFVFVGSGAQEGALRSEVRRRDLSNVRFLPAQPRETLDVSIGAADLHLVTLKPGCERYVFPSKLYGILAVARPILFVGPPDCELARFVESSGIGRVVDRDRTDEFAAAVVELATHPRAYQACLDAVARVGTENTAEQRLAAWHEALADVHACSLKPQVYTDLV